METTGTTTLTISEGGTFAPPITTLTINDNSTLVANNGATITIANLMNNSTTTFEVNRTINHTGNFINSSVGAIQFRVDVGNGQSIGFYNVTGTIDFNSGGIKVEPTNLTGFDPDSVYFVTQASGGLTYELNNMSPPESTNPAFSVINPPIFDVTTLSVKLELNEIPTDALNNGKASQLTGDLLLAFSSLGGASSIEERESNAIALSPQSLNAFKINNYEVATGAQ